MADTLIYKYVERNADGQVRWTLPFRSSHSIGISGPSGAGKTALIRTIARENLSAVTPVRIAYLPQNPRDLFPVGLPVLALAQAFASAQAEPKRFWADCRTILFELGLDPSGVLRARSASLSGGEVQRVAIAIILATEPQLLLADEPTSSLDAQAEAAVARLLAARCRSQGLALMIVSHSQALLMSSCVELFELRNGMLVSVALKLSDEPTPMHRSMPRARPLVNIAIRQHILPTREGRVPRRLLNNFRQTIKRGTVYGVAGPSGIGKSTLLRIMADHELPTHGTVAWAEHDPYRPRVILTPQDAKQFFDPRRSMEDHARMLAAALPSPPEFAELASILHQLEILDVAILARRADAVSGGEAQRLALAITLWLAPRLMCLDEIDTGVPAAMKERIGRLIRKQLINGNGAAVIVSHDMQFLAAHCDRIISLKPDIAVNAQ